MYGVIFMIVTVTINPAIDRTIEVDSLKRGSLNIIKRTVYDAGGKGINVSKTIKALGGKSIAAGFLGGSGGSMIQKALDGLGIASDFVWIDGETRTNTKITENDGSLTELNEKGPFIPQHKVGELMEKLGALAGKDTVFVLSGSVPAGVDKSIYADITKMAHSKGSIVLADTSGEPLSLALSQAPEIIKPNSSELEEYIGIKGASEEELISAADKLISTGIKTVALSMGEKGAVIITDEKRAKCPALDIKVSSAVGAGDAMVAALAYAYENKFSFEDTVRMCMAASAGAAATAGTKPPERSFVEELRKQVKILYI